MKINIDLGNALDHAIEEHLKNGTSVHAYVTAAVRFFRDMLKEEEGGSKIGFSKTNAEHFGRYNEIVSPKNYLDNEN